MSDHKKILDYVLSSHAPVIGATIRKMQERYPHLKGQDYGDLYEAAANAAMRAIHGHDPDKGAKLSTYMSQKIGHSLLQRFQPTDVSSADRDSARRLRSDSGEERAQVQTTTKVGRGAIEAAGGNVSDDGGSSGVSIVRNTAADFARQNPQAMSEIQRKVDAHEKRQAAKQPSVQETPAPQPEAQVEKPKSPQIIVRRKQVESSLAPEQADRMSRIDSKKGGQ